VLLFEWCCVTAKVASSGPRTSHWLASSAPTTPLLTMWPRRCKAADTGQSAEREGVLLAAVGTLLSFEVKLMSGVSRKFKCGSYLVSLRFHLRIRWHSRMAEASARRLGTIPAAAAQVMKRDGVKLSKKEIEKARRPTLFVRGWMVTRLRALGNHALVRAGRLNLGQITLCH
jgi:hypothetical protein